MPSQEKGTRPASPIPYELYCNGKLDTAKNAFQLTLKSGNVIFGKESAGAPFVVYAYGDKDDKVKVRNYAVKAGDALTDSWNLDQFDGQNYHLAVYGPNGFLRQYQGNSKSPKINFEVDYQLDKSNKATGNVVMKITSPDVSSKKDITILDNSYKSKSIRKTLEREATILLNLEKSFNWYDFSVLIDGQNEPLFRFAGHVETGKESKSDPFMGQMV